MQLTGLDTISYQSRWYGVSPVRKFWLWVAMMVLAFALPPIGQACLLAVVAALTCWLLRISFWRWCRWMALSFSFLLLGVVTLLFSVSHEPTALLWSVPVGGVWIGISYDGLVMANATFWRSLAALASTFWLVLNLPFPQLIVLLQRARVPRLMTEQILLTWRFIFILLEEALAIHRAQTLRFGYRRLPQGYKSFAMLVGLLFTRVLMRYRQMATVLDIKLYQGDFHL